MMTGTNVSKSDNYTNKAPGQAGVNPKLWSIMAKLTEVKLILDDYTDSMPAEFKEQTIASAMEDHLHSSIVDCFIYASDLL